ncbi:MAG: hypothetical protein ABIG28_00230 [archaeon]
MQKRGELTSFQIVVTILAIAGFVIVLITILIVVDIEGQSEDEICKLSVLTRATVPEEAQQLAPLKCHTKKVCLTLGDNDCPQFLGEKNVDYITLSKTRTPESVEKIEHTSAEAMLNCWNMMGQGKLNLFTGREGETITNFAFDKINVKDVHPKCVICSRVALSTDLQNEGKYILKDVNINDYLRETPADPKKPDSPTYLQIFTDRQVGSYPADFKAELNSVRDDERTTTTEMAFIFSQFIVDPRSKWNQFIEKGLNTGVALGTGALLTPAGKAATLTVGAIPTAISVLVGAIISGGLAYKQATANQGLAAVYCGDFTGGKNAGSKQGCSLVSPIDYTNISKINSLCQGGIEGFP